MHQSLGIVLELVEAERRRRQGVLMSGALSCLAVALVLLWMRSGGFYLASYRRSSLGLAGI